MFAFCRRCETVHGNWDVTRLVCGSSDPCMQCWSAAVTDCVNLQEMANGTELNIKPPLPQEEAAGLHTLLDGKSSLL